VKGANELAVSALTALSKPWLGEKCSARRDVEGCGSWQVAAQPRLTSFHLRFPLNLFAECKKVHGDADSICTSSN
jgi:hypothetical protein